MRTLLSALVKQGHHAVALSATVFDTQAAAEKLKLPPAQPTSALRTLMHEGVKHLLVPTRHWRRTSMTSLEEEVLERHFHQLLNQSPPDVFITYGGMLLERCLMGEARRLGIPTVFRLVNPNYRNKETFRDVDLIITDSQATAHLYKERLGLDLHAMGALVDSTAFRAERREPTYVTFVNPSPQKGVSLFARLALMCQNQLPDVQFLVVESRGQWGPSLQQMGLSESDFPNVRVIPSQSDMRVVYAKTKILLAPSFWHESGGRVALEAVVNGIPVLAASHGGLGELLAGAGVLLDIPEDVRLKPKELVDASTAKPWFETLERLISQPAAYADACDKAEKAGLTYDLHRSVQRFLDVLMSTENNQANPIVPKRAPGDR